MKLVLAVTCYNRIDFIKSILETWQETKSNNDWTLIIADDGSSQEQITYLENYPFYKKIIIKNYRRGISHQTNCIFKELEKIQYDVCFKCDEDIFFLKDGWDIMYADTILNTPYKHLCYDNQRFNYGKWCENAVVKPPEIRVVNGRNLIAFVKNSHVKGCFFTITPEVQKIVGFMDVVNFFHGYEHNDFSMRCARAGFNDKELGFDVLNSEHYIQYRFNERPSLNRKELTINGSGLFTNTIKRKLLHEDRIYIPYIETNRRMRSELLL